MSLGPSCGEGAGLPVPTTKRKGELTTLDGLSNGSCWQLRRTVSAPRTAANVPRMWPGAAAHEPAGAWQEHKHDRRSVPYLRKPKPSTQAVACGLHTAGVPATVVTTRCRMQWPAQHPHHIHSAAQHAQQQAPLQTMAVVCPHVRGTCPRHPYHMEQREKGQGSHVGAAGRRHTGGGGSCQVAAIASAPPHLQT